MGQQHLHKPSIHYGGGIPETGFVRLPNILKAIPVGRSTWWKGVKSGRFPPAVKLGPRTTAWRAEDIWKLIASFAADNTDVAQHL